MYYNNLYTRQSTGKLIVFSFEGNKAIPVTRATVTITGNNQNITLQTNESGQTEAITLPAKEPYSAYSVSVSANGYNTVKINGVQVVPNTTAIQEVQMTKNREGYYRPTEEHQIPKHKLEQPEPKKPDINPLTIPEPTTPSRPDAPPIGLLIPEYIIVHCGAPADRTAPNYKVRFADYITKVACGEIYSEWHPEALKANILCITSFTLNRLFTQTYEGFDITCLINFDHKYDPRQTTYKEIIEVVDNIFNQYIKHPDPNLKQPFLAEYRAHKKYCKLGQYDSQERAKRGENHLYILQESYKPCYRPIEITETAGVIFQGRPTSPPATILKEGSSGTDVREIQVFLNKIGEKYEQITKPSIDGKFGAKTTESVKTFQKVFTIPQNGIVDFRTWYKITDLYYSILDYKLNHESRLTMNSIPVTPKISNQNYNLNINQGLPY